MRQRGLVVREQRPERRPNACQARTGLVQAAERSGELRAPEGRVEIGRDGTHRPPVGLELAVRVPAGSEQEDGTPAGCMDLGRVERQLARGEEREGRERGALVRSGETRLELLEQQPDGHVHRSQRARRASPAASTTTVFARLSSTVPRRSSSRSTRFTVAREVPASPAMSSCVSGMTTALSDPSP